MHIFNPNTQNLFFTSLLLNLNAKFWTYPQKTIPFILLSRTHKTCYFVSRQHELSLFMRANEIVPVTYGRNNYVLDFYLFQPGNDVFRLLPSLLSLILLIIFLLYSLSKLFFNPTLIHQLYKSCKVCRSPLHIACHHILSHLLLGWWGHSKTRKVFKGNPSFVNNILTARKSGERPSPWKFLRTSWWIFKPRNAPHFIFTKH